MTSTSTLTPSGVPSLYVLDRESRYCVSTRPCNIGTFDHSDTEIRLRFTPSVRIAGRTTLYTERLYKLCAPAASGLGISSVEAQPAQHLSTPFGDLPFIHHFQIHSLRSTGWAPIGLFTAGGPSKFDFPAPLSLLEPVGTGSAEACGMIKVQAHYNVPNASMTVVDTSSAVRLGVVRDLRPHAQRTEPRYLFLCDADSGFRIPADREAHTVALECDIGNRAPASLTSVYPHLHTHGIGVRMATARDKRHLAAWPHFDYRKWESRAEPGATLAVNERVRFECTYSTAGERTPIDAGGTSTRNEMCTGAIFVTADATAFRAGENTVADCSVEDVDGVMRRHENGTSCRNLLRWIYKGHTTTAPTSSHSSLSSSLLRPSASSASGSHSSATHSSTSYSSRYSKYTVPNRYNSASSPAPH